MTTKNILEQSESIHELTNEEMATVQGGGDGTVTVDMRKAGPSGSTTGAAFLKYQFGTVF
jgi:bacteriocin-like protein